MTVNYNNEEQVVSVCSHYNNLLFCNVGTVNVATAIKMIIFVVEGACKKFS